MLNPPPPYQERGFYRYIFPDLYPFRIWDQQEHNIPWPFTLLGMYSLTFVDIYIYIYICGNPTSYKLVQKGVICGRVGKKAGNIFGKNLSPPSDLTQIWNFQLLFFSLILGNRGIKWWRNYYGEGLWVCFSIYIPPKHQ